MQFPRQKSMELRADAGKVSNLRLYVLRNDNLAKLAIKPALTDSLQVTKKMKHQT